jgi:hypothetical protein
VGPRHSATHAVSAGPRKRKKANLPPQQLKQAQEASGPVSRRNGDLLASIISRTGYLYFHNNGVEEGNEIPGFIDGIPRRLYVLYCLHDVVTKGMNVNCVSTISLDAL